MGSEPQELTSPIVFALKWIGVAVVVCALVGVVAGLVRDDVAGTMGPVIQWGMTAAAIAIVATLAFRRG